MLRLVLESAAIETVGDLLLHLSGYPEDMPITDGLGEALILREQEDMETGEHSLEIE